MGKDMQYKLLVRAINEDTNEELAQTVSQGFAVSFRHVHHTYSMTAGPFLTLPQALHYPHANLITLVHCNLLFRSQ